MTIYNHVVIQGAPSFERLRLAVATGTTRSGATSRSRWPAHHDEVSSTIGNISDRLDSSHTMTMGGPGLIRAKSSAFYVGLNGTGELMISGGGKASVFLAKCTIP